jgi:hypothetical protein
VTPASSVTIADVKTCRRCCEERERSAFPRNARTRDRLSSRCAPCHNEAKRRSRRNRRVQGLLAEEAELERQAASETGWRAKGTLALADDRRRQVARELVRGDG